MPVLLWFWFEYDDLHALQGNRSDAGIRHSMRTLPWGRLLPVQRLRRNWLLEREKIMIDLTVSTLASFVAFLNAEGEAADLGSIVITKHKNDTCFWAVLGGLPDPRTCRYFENGPMTDHQWKEWLPPNGSPEERWQLKEACVAV